MPTNEELESQLATQARINALLEREAELRNKVTDSTRTQADVQSDFFNIFDSGSKSTEKAASGQQDLASALDGVANSQKNVGEQTGFAEKAMLFLNKATKSVSIGFENMMRVMKPLYNFIMLNPVFDMLAKNLGNVRQAQQGAFEAAQQFKETLGTLPETIKKFNKFVGESSKTLGKTGRSLASISGIEYGDVTKKFLGYAGEMGIGFDHFMEKAQGAYGEIILFKEGLGLSIDALEDMTYRFGEASFGDFSKMLVGGSNELGLSLKNVSKNFQAGIKDGSNFGYMTRKELSATSLYATKLGMEMSELTAFGDKFDTFEGAAESVGKLSAAFGIQLDTMDLVMEDNPAKKLDMVREALEKSGQSMDSILGDKRQAKYLADSIGLPIEQLEKLASISSDEFGFTDAFDAAADAQENMTEMDAMQQISKDIRDLNTAMNPMNNSATSFFGSFIDGFTTAAEKGGVFKEVTFAMKSALDSFYSVGQRVYKLTSDLFKGSDKDGPAGPLRGMVQPFLDYFKDMEGVAAKLMGDGTDKNPGLLKEVFNYIGEFLSGDGTVKGEKKNIFSILFSAFDDVDRPSLLTPSIQKGLINLAKLLVDSLASAFRFIGSESIKWVGKLFDVSKDAMKKDPDTGKSMMDFGKDMFSAIGEMLSDLFTAGSGLSAFLIGGTFQGVNHTYEESLFGKMFAETGDFLSGPSPFQDILGNLIGGLLQMFGDNELGRAFQAGGVGISDKFSLMILKVKATVFQSLAELSAELAHMGEEGLKQFGDVGVLDEFTNPSVMIFQGLAKLGTSPGGKGLTGLLSSKAFAAKKELKAGMAVLKDMEDAYLESFDSSGQFQESAVDIGESMGSDLNQGVVKGLAESIPTDAIDEWGNRLDASMRVSVDTQSPSMMTYDIGVDMADGLVAGFFGNDGLITGSEETGFIKKFDKEMLAVGDMIESAYGDISRAAVMSIETKLGRVGEILSGNKPLSVVVDNKQLQIKLAVNVVMDSNDVASGIASAKGGSYFNINTNRNGEAEEFRELEISND